MTATILLIRHGPHGDLGERLTGRGTDDGLTHDGQDEVERLARSLTLSRLTAVYSSPRRRTQETARLVAAPHGLPIILAPELDEIDFGDWTGCRFADLDGRRDWHRWNSNRADARTPGGESMREAQARAVAFAIQAAASHEGAVALVTHCDIIRALLCWQHRRSLDDILEFEAGPASVTELDIAPAEPVAA